MTEPAATTASGALLQTGMKGAASGSLTAAALPLDPLTMAVGLVAALVALLHTPPTEGEPRTPLRVFALVVGSGFLAGVFVPVAAAGGINYLPWLATAGDRPLQLAAAAVIGAAPHIGPVLWRLWRQTKGGQS
jgi:hypothetical protein